MSPPDLEHPGPPDSEHAPSPPDLEHPSHPALEHARFGALPIWNTRALPLWNTLGLEPSRFGTRLTRLAPNLAGEVSSLERLVEVSRTDDAKAAMEELKAKAEQAAKAADDDDTEADPTKPLTWPLAYAVESEASAAAAEAEAAKAVLSSEELCPNMEAAEAAEAVLSSDQLSAEGAPSTAPTSPKPPNTAPLSPRITSLASPRAGDSSPLQKLQSQSAAKMAINPTPEEARDTPITRAFKEKIAAERESFIKSREPDWR